MILTTALVRKILANLPLKLLLIIPFLVQIFFTVGLVGYLSYHNAQITVSNLVEQLVNEAGDRIKDRLDYFNQEATLMIKVIENDFFSKTIDFNDFENLQQYFWERIQLIKYTTGLAYIDNKNNFIGSRKDLSNSELIFKTLADSSTNYSLNGYLTNHQGNKIKLADSIPNYDVTKRPWYPYVRQYGNQKIVWCPIYKYFHIDSLGIALGMTLSDQNGDFQGIIGGHFALSFLGKFLQSLDISKNTQILLVERNGYLVATNTLEKLWQEDAGEIRRLTMMESKNPLIAATANYLNQHFADISEIKTHQLLKDKILDEKYFVIINPYQNSEKLDWLIITIIPETDFMAQINANTKLTIQLCILAFIVAILIGIVTARWITKPILQLNKAAKNVAAGNWNQTLEINRTIELMELGLSFNLMAQQLKRAFNNLEEQVKIRTKELLLAKEKAEIANQAKSAFIANISHELRSPLNAILGFSQLLLNSSNLSNREKENVSIIYNSGNYLLSLINEILSFAKIETGKEVIKLSNVDLYQFVEEIKKTFELKAQNKGLLFELNYTSDTPQYIRTDALKLRKILTNLIDNGVKFTKVGGVSVQVTWKQESSSLLLTIQDTGVGISLAEIESIFEPFTQSQSGKEAQEGTGLGLTITSRLIEILAGEIKVDSQVNQGTIFTISLPVAVVSSPELSESQSPGKIIGLASNQPVYRMLIVDDSPYNRRLLLELLQPLDFELREASNGQEAVEIWSNWEPHLIWMDIRMPLMDGYTATRQIKSAKAGKSTIIIAVSSNIPEFQKSLLLAVGCSDILEKPFQESTVFNLIAKYLGLRYLYEKTPLISKSPSLTNLTPENLSFMGDDWLRQLHQASINLDEAETERLISFIPSDYPHLIESLNYLVKNYSFDKIRRLTQKYEQ